MIQRLVFMGTPNFSVPILEALLHGPWKVVGVYTQPPRPAGRGYKVLEAPVHKRALIHSIPVFTPKSLRGEDAQKELRALAPDVIVVAAYGLLLPKTVLDIPPLGCVNVHASLLPRWRGAAPIQRALLAGDQKTGIAIMHMEEGLDTGPVYSMASLPITPTMTAPQLHDALSQMGAQEIMPVLQRLGEPDYLPTPQPDEGVTYAHKLLPEEGRLDWTMPAALLDRTIRALNPTPGTFCFLGEGRLKILAATPINETYNASPGEIVHSNLTVACGEGALRITLLQKAGAKPLPTEVFLNGCPLLPGTRLL